MSVFEFLLLFLRQFVVTVFALNSRDIVFKHIFRQERSTTTVTLTIHLSQLTNTKQSNQTFGSFETLSARSDVCVIATR